MRSRYLTAVVAVAALCPIASAVAQTDYRNLDEGRPVHTEDAYAVERYAFELITGAALEKDAGGLETTTFTAELEHGVVMNGQIGLAAPLAVVNPPGSGLETFGLAGLRLHALYNFNTESGSLPALGLRTDLALPVGALAGDVARVTVKAIATRSWGLTRAHANVAWSFGSENGLADADVAPRWSASIAVDRTFFRSSILLVAEGLIEEAVRGAPTVATLAVGGRWQWSPTRVIDLGLARRVTANGASLAVTIGLSHVFGARGLLPAGRR
ncbi:MAG TPA: hypothetical protein VIE46_02730 [Gemmatimonadales bacterium]